MCVDKNNLCDGWLDCNDGSDEIMSLCCMGDFKKVYDKKRCTVKNPEPLEESSIFIKTFKWTGKTYMSVTEIEEELVKKPTKGYCEKNVEAMTAVSNKRLCKGVNRNVGYYYRVEFPVCQSNLKYAFKLPVDFGQGGVVVLDGKIIKQEKTDIWEGGKSTKLNVEFILGEGNHVLEVYGSEVCCDGTTSWSFKVHNSTWMPVTTKNLDKNMVCGLPMKLRECKDNEFQCENGQCIPESQECDGKSQCSDDSDEDFESCCLGLNFPEVYDVEECSGGLKNRTKPERKTKCKKGFFNCGDNTCIPESQVCDGVDQCKTGRDENDKKCCAGDFEAYGAEQCNHKPVINETESGLRKSEIFIKTVSFKKSTITKLAELKKKMTKKSGKGYCERKVDNMLRVSNKALCKGVNRNVGFYYKITFPVCNNGLKYHFKLPVDFGRGGISMMDGKAVKTDKSDIWQGGRSKKLDFSVTLNRGNHVLELYGSEGCCDGTTSWKFKVGKSKWMTFTVDNLNECFAIEKFPTKKCKKNQF